MKRFPVLGLLLCGTLGLGQSDQAKVPATGNAGTEGRSGGPGVGWASPPEYRIIYGQRVYHVGGDVSPPQLLKSTVDLSQTSINPRHLSGTVIIWAIVDRDGVVRHPRVVRSLEPKLDEIALRTVKTWRFAPARKSGEPVPAEWNLSYSFGDGKGVNP
jgi:TonB family protein